MFSPPKSQIPSSSSHNRNHLSELTEQIENHQVSPKIMKRMKRPSSKKSLVDNRFALFLCFCLVIIFNSPAGVSGHIAAFISSEGRPNLTPRPIRGPTVPTNPFYHHSSSSNGGGSSEILRLPGLTFVGSGGGGGGGAERKMYLRNNMNDRSFANVNSGISSSSTSGSGAGGNEVMMLDDEDKPTFVPYIGPRALSSVKAYLRHIRENLEALQSSEYVERLGSDGEIIDYDDNVDNNDDYQLMRDESDKTNQRQPSPRHHLDKQHSRRHINPNIVTPELNRDKSDSRQFVEQPHPLPYPNLPRRNLVSNYSPSWSYTKLGLGKRASSLRRPVYM